MNELKRYGLVTSLAVFLTWALAGCGGNEDLPPKASISQVYVMGDSLADVGTFGGVKFTVQDPVTPRNALIWPQIIANQLGVNGAEQCNFFTATGATFGTNTSPGCTNYAIGGGRIRAKDANGGTLSPLTVGTQMATRALSGDYNAGDLVLIVGGGNDAADLITAFLGAANDATNTAGLVTAFQTFLQQQLTPSVMGQLLTQDPTGASAGLAYMSALADSFYQDVATNVLAKNATHVAILNMPDITITPQLQTQLSPLGPARSAQVQALVRSWIGTFNAQLKTRIGTDSRIALVDFYNDFQDQVNKPANYGLTNVSAPVCTATVGLLGNFPCLSSTLDASPPAGKAAGWWKTYAFSDGFHPTPFGHSLLAASVARALARAGWL